IPTCGMDAQPDVADGALTRGQVADRWRLAEEDARTAAVDLHEVAAQGIAETAGPLENEPPAAIRLRPPATCVLEPRAVTDYPAFSHVRAFSRRTRRRPRTRAADPPASPPPPPMLPHAGGAAQRGSRRRAVRSARHRLPGRAIRIPWRASWWRCRMPSGRPHRATPGHPRARTRRRPRAPGRRRSRA